MVETDAAHIVDLRAWAGRYLNRTAADIDAQITWLNAYFARAGDYYFVVETIDGRCREGLIGLYDVKRPEGTGEWGRWILEPGSNAAIESALLIYRFVFETLALENVCCRTLCANEKVAAFHDSCGLARRGDPVTIEHDGRPSPAIEHRLHRTRWPTVNRRLERLASRFATTALRSQRRSGSR